MNELEWREYLSNRLIYFLFEDEENVVERTRTRRLVFPNSNEIQFRSIDYLLYSNDI